MSRGMQQVIWVDGSKQFWPHGWLTYVAIGLGVLDAGLLFLVIRALSHGF